MSEAPLNLEVYINLFMRRKRLFFITALSIMTLGIFFTYMIPKKYEATSTVFIEKNIINELVKGITVAPNVDASMHELTTLMNSRTLIMKAIVDVDFNQRSKNDAELEKLITEIQRNTEIKSTEKGFFKITFKYYDPKIARDYVNALVRQYIGEEVAAKRSESYDATSFLAEQIATFGEKVAKSESEVNKFKTQKSAIINLDASQLFREINLAQQKLFDLQLRRKQLEEEKHYVKELADPVRQKLRVLEKRLEELRVQYTDSYPEVASVKAQIETLQREAPGKRIPGSASLDISPDIWKIDAELKAITENEIAIKKHIDENRTLLASIPGSKNELEKLEAAKSTERIMHDLLTSRSNQAELSKQMEIQDKGISYRIIDPAVTPINPVSPNRKKLLLMSIVAGLAVASGGLFLLDQFDTSVKLVDSLRPLGYPILAVIPLIKSETEISAEKNAGIKIYMVSGAYFCCILTVVLMEFMGISLFESLLYKLHLPQLFAGFFKG